MNSASGRRVSLGTGRHWGLLALLLLYGLFNPYSISYASQSQPTQKELQKQILTDLAAGKDVQALLADFRQRSSSNPVTPVSNRSTSAAQFQQQILNLKQLVQQILSRGELTVSDVSRLSEQNTRLQALHLLLEQRFISIKNQLAEAGVNSGIEQRRVSSQNTYLKLAEDLLEQLAALIESVSDDNKAGLQQADVQKQKAAQLNALKQKIDQFAWSSPKPILRSSVLPYQAPEYPQRTPDLSTSITPSYADQSVTPSVAGDLAATVDAPLNKPILQKAEELGHDYINIFEFVRTQINTEWYAGSMKGAVGTLQQMSGNDVDQASLLIALFRASGLPARYVQGVVELPIDVIIEQLGLTDANQAVQFLTAAGVAFTPQVRGGQVAAVQIEHTWVTALIPYTNYRGAVIDQNGKAWVPLVPALKQYQITPSKRILETMAFDTNGRINEYLTLEQQTDLLGGIRQSVTQYLQQNLPDENYEQQLGGHAINSEAIGLIPHTLPLTVIGVTGESRELPEASRQMVRIRVRQNLRDNGSVVLEHRLPVSSVAGQRLTLSYQPATVDDQTTINLYGGVDNVPAYLVKLKPQLKLNGRQIAVAKDNIDMGVSHKYEVVLETPNGNFPVDKTIIAGGYDAIGVQTRHYVAPPTDVDNPADTEYEAAKILNRLVQEYSDRWTQAEQELAGLLDVAVARPLPSVAISSTQYQVDTLFGQPYSLEFQGLSLDAAFRQVQGYARNGTAQTAKEWMQLAALQGSSLEGDLFEELFLVESISADEGLRLARLNGQTIHTLNSANIDSVLPSLVHPQAVLEDIQNWARQGMTIRIPETAVAHNDWSGSVWMIEDPDSGASGYFISGGLAGGSTTVYPSGWVLDWLASAMAAANSPPPNTDPLSVAKLTKIYSTDAQEGEVGTDLPVEFTVIAQDEIGRTVAGAEVTFTVTNGNGKLSGSDSSVIVKTNDAGIASASFTLDTSTRLNPHYVYLNENDEHLTQAGLNIVDVVAVSREGPVFTAEPFHAIAYPGEAVKLVRTDAQINDGELLFGWTGIWSDTPFIQPVDQYDNPVSNVNVTYTMGATQAGCPVASSPQPGAVVDNASMDSNGCPRSPLFGECGSTSFTDKSTIWGTSAGVILGPIRNSIYPLTVTGAGDSKSYSYKTAGDCVSGPWFNASTNALLDNKGNIINATKVGTQYQRPIPVIVRFNLPSVDRIEKGQVYWLPDVSTYKVDAQVNFSVSNGGSTSGSASTGTGEYETLVTTGPTAGENIVNVQLRDIQAQDYLDLLKEAIKTAETNNQHASAEGRYNDAVERLKSGANYILNKVTGVDPTIEGLSTLGPIPTGMDPNSLFLNTEGQTEFRAEVNYTINPSVYKAQSADVDFFENDAWTWYQIGSSLSGAGDADIHRGSHFDTDNTYEAQVVLNRGSIAEIKSDKFEIKLGQRLFKNVDRQVHVKQDVDILNQRYCQLGSSFDFTLTEAARVSLVFTGIDSSREVTLIDDELRAEGEHTIPVLPTDLLPGNYTFELTGVSERTGLTEVKTGGALSEYETRDHLPVGHTLVKGVNIYQGSLSTSSGDLSVPGRGVPLEFNRTYHSGESKMPGSLGHGWTHNYDSKIVITPCGEVIVTGAYGGGMRFVEEADGTLRPQKGYHGTLTPDFTDNSFDFYSKDGTRYHYRNFGSRAEWNLEYIEDTNGNVTKLGYDPSSRDVAKLITVEDPAGRTLSFSWEDRYFTGYELEPTPVITQVEAPDGMTVAFTYDEYGNLTQAAREGDAKVDTYEYATDATLAFELRHNLIKHTNPNGAVTEYTYNPRQFEVSPGGQPTLYLPYAFVTSVKDPEGGVTTFDYAQPNPSDTTTVTDGRGNVTTYTMNQYGSPLQITDPVGTTSMTWASDDVLMTSRIDANGVETRYTHDEHGNVLTETVDTGLFSGYTTTNSYASIPGKLWIKNRLASKTDRNDHTTQYRYDGNGNLVETEDAEGNIVQHRYADNGDRISTRDARGNDTRYQYDTYGNLSAKIDALGNTTRGEWNIRSLPVSRTDPRGNTSRFAYDTLNRLNTRTDPLGNTREYTYDPVGNKLTETDEEGRTTTWTYDLENRVKTVTDPLNSTLSYAYDAVGNKTRQTDWRGYSTTFDYDGANRLTRQVEPMGKVTSYTYDGVGNVLSETDAKNNSTSYEYDELNRRTRITDALAGEVVIEYDGENKIKEIDQLGRETRYSYDNINRPVSRTEPLGRITRYAYDANSNKISETDPNGNERQFEYDELNRLTKSVDALNYATNYQYDANGNLIVEIDARLHDTHHEYDALNRRISTTDPLDNVTRFGYDRIGNPIREEWANGNVITRTYDRLNRLVESADELGITASYRYDESGNRTRETDANGNITTHTYDPLNRRTRSDLPENRFVTVSYDLVGNKLSEQDPNANVTRYDYDALYRLTQVTDPLNQTVTSSYDAVGNKLTETDKRNHTTRFEYDDLNRRIKVTDPLAQVMEYSYDLVGNKISETDKRGTVTKYAYDAENRLLTVMKDNVVISTMEYDAVGNKKFDTDANGNITAYLYDKRNLLITESRPQAAITNYQYDEMGDRVRERDPEGRVSTWTYDLRQRMETETNGLNQTTTQTYDDNGNRISTRRPNGNSWSYAYDGVDRLVSITDPLAGVTEYSYDNNGNRLSQRDANNNTTRYDYDALDRQTSTTYPDGATESYQYDANGNRTQLTDARGQIFSYTYDELNRQTRRDYPAPTAPTGDDIQSITTDYDANNNPVTITESYSGTTSTRVTSKRYDNFDRLISVTDAFARTIKYAYDANGNRTGLIDPDGKQTSYSFDALNRLVNVTTAAGTTTYSYDRSSLQTRVSYPNGVQADNSYDAARRIANITNRQGSTIISEFTYTYDDNGNRLTQVETNGGAEETTNYDYDANDRLIEVAYPEETVTYTYDANYNRLSEVSVASVGSTTIVDKAYSYNSRNELENITDNRDTSQNVTYQYDANGNQTIKSKNGVVTTFIYDVRDQLISVREDSTTLGDFFYDYQGLRVAKHGEDGLVRYTYDDDSVLTQHDADGATLAKYEYGPDRLLSLDHFSEGRQFYLFDALGSVVNLTQPDASVQARYQYDAWGHFRAESGTSWNDFTFTGHEKDRETGLFYFKARYYDPDTGRFLNQDAYLGEVDTPPSLHRYLYAYSNPTVYIDPDGNITVEQSMGIDEESVARDIESGATGTGDAIKYAAKKTFYTAWNFLTAGFLERQDARQAKYDSGEITQSELYSGAALDAGVSISSTVLGGQLGSKITARLGNGLTANAVGNASSGAFTDLAVQSGQVAENRLVSDKLGQESVNLEQATVAAGTGIVYGTITNRLAAKHKITTESDSGVGRVVSSEIDALKRIGTRASQNQELNKLISSRQAGSVQQDQIRKRVQTNVANGTTVYRQGSFADEAIGWEGNYVKGKQWASDNPLTTPDYAKKYGLPAENTGSPDWIVKGRVEGPYSTRPAPASHNNPANTGGGTEVLPNNPNDVKLDWFHMPD